MLNEHFSLGLALDTFGVGGGDDTDFENDGVGIGGLSVQFNWYL